MDSIGDEVVPVKPKEDHDNTAKCLPDPLLVAKDIRDQLKCVKFGTPLKLKISSCMKEAEELLRCATVRNNFLFDIFSAGGRARPRHL
ncbi:Hypothetical protein NTJ_15591 [Nesidiocoris tenuis]|uniref:Uncharacterized protein n=1 Tax=Nesidiocoris tenuis TaxID=355587 RepID=A0ABN7BES6_9HEMI|nr:Hypothetical protein NTJ_15591 [Nesidiocoris tenuis]